MWRYPWTHVGKPSHPGHLDRVAAILPCQDIGQWEGQDVKGFAYRRITGFTP